MFHTCTVLDLRNTRISLSVLYSLSLTKHVSHTRCGSLWKPYSGSCIVRGVHVAQNE